MTVVTADQLAAEYEVAIATLTPAQVWAVDIRRQAETLGAFTGATIEVRRARLFAAEARRLSARVDPP